MVKKITIVSLSKGILGEDFIKHELNIGLKRLSEYGIQVKFSKNALKGMDFISSHPEERANDLIDAMKDDSDMILCAVGGDDTYRLLPYLFANDELKKAANQKIFLGFSDTTMNHLMLHKVGVKTFYGQAFLPDVCELFDTMLPYSKTCFEELISTGTISKITPSDVWYNSREDFSPEAIGSIPTSHKNSGFELIQGHDDFDGEILGGCIDTIYDIFDNKRYADTIEVCGKYNIFPSLDDWKGKILLLESSEEKATPRLYEDMLIKLKQYGVFDVVSGVIIGKPADEEYFDEYKELLKAVINNKNLPIVVNINVGHATPRCIIPFGVKAHVSVAKQEIKFER